jgi:hypothetical protein
LIGTSERSYPICLLQNQGSGNFRIVEGAFLDSVSSPSSIAVSADVNADGRVDVIISNYRNGYNGNSMQILLNKQVGSEDCPDGGVPLHGSSWCFPCPSFMGRSTNSIVGLPPALCQECSPDHIQNESNEQCSSEPCSSFGERKLGNNVCVHVLPRWIILQQCHYSFRDSTIILPSRALCSL